MLLIPSILLAASVLVSGSSAAAGLNAEPVTKPCTLSEGWAEVASRQPRYVVFGELHGSQQSPAFIGDLACALASQNQRILVAVELDSTADYALQQAWRLPVASFEKALGAVGWKERKDGVTSEAMFAMLVRLHKLKEAGGFIDVVAFNGTKDDAQQKRFSDLAAQGPHEAAQAENIQTAAAHANYDRVFVLVGNFHARKTRYGDGPESFDPMAARLASYGSVVSLDMRYAAGTAWNCLTKPGLKFEPGHPPPPGDIECGNHPARSHSDLKRAPFIGIGSFPGEAPDARFDGFFWLGPISGSAPEFP